MQIFVEELKIKKKMFFVNNYKYDNKTFDMKDTRGYNKT